MGKCICIDIPLVISKLLNNKKTSIYNLKIFGYQSIFIAIKVFLYHTYLVYGVVTLNLNLHTILLEQLKDI